MGKEKNVLTGPLFSLRGTHFHPVACCCVIPERLLVASADEGGTLVLWNLESRKTVDKRSLVGQILSLSYFIDMDNDRCVLFVQQRNGFILAFNITDKISDAPLYRINCAEYSYCRHTLSTSGAMVVPVKDINCIQVIDCLSQEVLVDDFPSVSAHGDIMAVAIRHNTVAVGCEDGVVLVYKLIIETMNSSLIAELKVLNESVTCLSFDLDGRLAVGGACNYLKIVEENLEIICSNSLRDSGVSSITTFNDHVISGGWDGKLRVFDRCLNLLQVSDDSIFNNIMDICAISLPRPIPGKDLMSRIHKIMITCSKDHLINVWQFNG
jgi:WD40 repeat protein